MNYRETACQLYCQLVPAILAECPILELFSTGRNIITVIPTGITRSFPAGKFSPNLLLVFMNHAGIRDRPPLPANAMKDTKQNLRKKMALLRPTLAHGNPQATLLQSPIWAASRTVAVYAAIRDEAPTDLLLKMPENKQVYLPKILDKTQQLMEFVPLTPHLTPGAFSIPEPVGGAPAAQVDLLVVPGLAFDRAGSRLGFGGGFYDRFLQDHPDFAKLVVGLCYTGQILDDLPRDDWDVRVNALCTEERIMWL